MAMKENKTQGKEGEDKGVFFWLRNDGAVNAQSHSAAGKIRSQPRIDPHILNEEISNRLVQHARPRPRRSLSCETSIVEGAAHPNANVIGDIYIIHEHRSNRAVDGRGADGDGGRVRRAGGKSDVGFAAAGNSGIDRCDVFGVGTGKQGRERDLRVGRRVGVVNVAGRLPAIRRRMVA